MSLQELRISKEVAATTEDCETYVPANGKEVTIYEFIGEAAYTTNACIKLVWRLGDGDEEVLWSTKGSSAMPGSIDVTDADGTRKLAVCLDNGESGPLFLSGYCKFEVED